MKQDVSIPKSKNAQGSSDALMRLEFSVLRKILFSSIGFILFFSGLEILLTLFGVRPVSQTRDPLVGFSSAIPLFVEKVNSDGRIDYVTARNKLRYFNNQQFPKSKPQGVYRVFCVGGSTTFGRPYNDKASYTGWMRELLPRIDSSKEWEIINTGGISYASYRLTALMEELVRYSPDLFIIYTGHNEFLEKRTYGDLFRQPELLRQISGLLSSTRTYSVIDHLIHGSRLDEGSQNPGSSRPILLSGEVNAILDRTVGPEAYKRDDVFATDVIHHFEFNLNRMLDIANASGASVILITPAGNLMNCSPFKSVSSAEVIDSARSENDRLLIRAESWMEEEDYDQALDAIEKALLIDSRYARTHYLRGKTLAALGRLPEAVEAFLSAKDEDVCPLRATTSIVNVVRRVAEIRSIPLVDFDRFIMEDELKAGSEESRFLDHVHPTILGHGFLAGKIVDTMVSEGMVTIGKVNAADIMDEIGVLIESRLDIADQARSLINLSQVMAWGGKFEEAGRIGEEAASLPGIDRRPQLLAEANLRVAVSEHALGNQKRAVLFFRKSSLADPKVLEKYLRTMLEQKPGNAFFLNHLGLVLRDQDRLDEAVAVFKRAIASRPEQSGFHKNIGLLYFRLGRIGEAVNHYRQALKAPDWDLAIANNLAFLLAAHSDPSIRNPEEALKWAERCVEETQYKSAEILDTFATVLAANNRFDEAIKWQKKAVDSAGENRRSEFQSRLELYRQGKEYEYR